LYDESCSGYEQAYFDMRCSNDPLYDSSCPGYAEAFFDQQCSANALYDTGCPGYAEAFFDQQCSNDPLYDSACPGYETAYFNQQCSIDTLYNPGCPGYEEAYAEQQLERTCSANPQSDPRCDDYVEPSVSDDNTQVATPSSNPTNDFTKLAITGDATVDSVIRNDDTNDTQQQQTVVAAPVPTIKPAPIEEREREEEQIEDVEENNSDDESDEERSDRRKKMKDIAEREARSLADDMGKAASIEQQQATQARVMSLISFVPDFGSYARKGIPQPTDYYASTSIYDDATIPDSNFGARNGLAQEILHRRMVDMQYNREGN